MKEFNISKIEYKRILGRNVYKQGDEGLTLFWGGAAFEINVRGREVYACLSAAYEGMESWVTVEINGVSVSRFVVDKEKRNYCLARNLNPEKENLITIIRDTQPLNEDCKSALFVNSIFMFWVN